MGSLALCLQTFTPMNCDSLGACQGDPRLPILQWNWFLPLLFPWAYLCWKKAMVPFFPNATLRRALLRTMPVARKIANISLLENITLFMVL